MLLRSCGGGGCAGVYAWSSDQRNLTDCHHCTAASTPRQRPRQRHSGDSCGDAHSHRNDDGTGSGWPDGWSRRGRFNEARAKPNLRAVSYAHVWRLRPRSVGQSTPHAASLESTVALGGGGIAPAGPRSLLLRLRIQEILRAVQGQSEKGEWPGWEG